MDPGRVDVADGARDGASDGALLGGGFRGLTGTTVKAFLLPWAECVGFRILQWPKSRGGLYDESGIVV